uniref:Homeobox domain-containing protein n=1 Tax=Salarias fasciatus TaxID=181472 RepID=A0A672J0I0_SALFA
MSKNASSPSTDSMSAVSWSIDEDIRSLVATDYSCTQKTKIPGKQRAKVIFSDSQKEALESRFEKQKYLKPCEIASVAAEIGLTYKQVRTWFQNQRGRLKKQNLQLHRDTRAHAFPAHVLERRSLF